MSFTSDFDKAMQSVTQQRGEIYGHPLDDFGRIARIKMVISDCPDPIVQHVLEMIAVKMCRLVETPDHLDSLIDIAGYARTACMAIDKRNSLQEPEL